jgi:hypothetical protein
MDRKSKNRKIRYAVVGLGHIAQVAVLPAFKHEPSGSEGLADVRIIEALYRLAKIKRPTKVSPVKRTQRPTMKQEIRRPAVRKPPLIHVESGSLS